MAQFPFAVENIVTLQRGRVYVLARALGPASFVFRAGASLGGCLIEHWTDTPRSVSADGEQRLDIFAFALCHPADGLRFSPGQEVVVETRAE